MLAGILGVLALASCAPAKAPEPSPPAAHRGLEPAEYCAKLAGFVATAKNADGVKLPCAYFTPLYEAMRKDNAASYACSARCAEESADVDAFTACEARARCTDATSTPEPRTPSSDDRLEAYCRQMTRIDDGAKPSLGMWTCAFIAGAMKRETPKTFDCSFDCATAATSMSGYHECLRAKGCADLPAGVSPR